MVVSKALIVVCTHNPNPMKIYRVLEAIRANSANFRIVVIDNASNNRSAWDFSYKFDYEIVLEDRLGNSFARYRALNLVKDDELLIFVDDDNQISVNYIETAIGLLMDNPEWGCFGGMQLLPSDFIVPKGFEIFLPYVGVRSLGETKLEADIEKTWNRVEPIGAGMCISPVAVRHIRTRLERDKEIYFSLGRKGKKLLSGEDSFLARSLNNSGTKFGYSSNLKLIHDIDPSRLTLKYVSKLMFGYGVSDVVLDKALNATPKYPYPSSFFGVLMHLFYSSIQHKYGVILGLRHLGQFYESSRRSYGFKES
jgi:glycosyltransferase involved in cell wall biosynthesis